MTTVDDFAQGMLREYSAFARRCAALVAAHGDEEAAAELYSIDDLPQIAEQLRAFRVRAEAAEARAAQAEADARLMLGLAAAEHTTRIHWRDGFGLGVPEMEAMYAAADHADAMPDIDVSAAVRRILATAGAT